jgi:hypothetical protein
MLLNHGPSTAYLYKTTVLYAAVIRLTLLNILRTLKERNTKTEYSYNKWKVILNWTTTHSDTHNETYPIN